MYASVHTDRSGRVFVSADHGAAAMGGRAPVPLTDATALPDGTELMPLEREAVAYDRGGRARPLGKGRLALAAVAPARTRLAFPAYVDDPAAPPLEPRPYAAVGADAQGRLVVAVADRSRRTKAAFTAGTAPIREHPANALARQLTRCARDHACAAARAGLGHGDLPVPLGAPDAERPRLPVALRSGYSGAPTDRAAFTPTVREIADVAATHLDRGGTGVSFGRACEGEPLGRIRVLEQAIGAVHDHAPRATIHLETCGSDPVAFRRAADAGLTSVAVRLASARAETYEALHGPVAHRWADVRACIQVAVERGVALTIALLVLPGVTDRSAEIDVLIELLGDLPGGRLELRDLGADPLRVVAALAGGRPLGMRPLLERIAEADHFRTDLPLAEATV